MHIVGMMSGTSLDGIDAVLGAFCEDKKRWHIVAHTALALPATLKQTLAQLNTPNHCDNELHTAKIAEQQLTHCYAKAYQQLLQQPAVQATSIVAIAAHGQTIRHQPNDEFPYSMQLLNGALLAHLTQQTIVCDFRSKDLAAGGQGAPLAPLFHRELLPLSSTAAVVNIGGISNLSVLTEHHTEGFDCGPGNCLLDEWVEKHRGQRFDKDGAWAMQGHILPKLLTQLLGDAYFSQSPPKSTGREYFHQAWLQNYLQGTERAVDVMRTLVRLTATTIVDCLPDEHEVLIVVGGGAKNLLLLEDLAVLLPNTRVCSSDDFGVDPQHVEALGFAVLGGATLKRRPLDTRAVTGAKQASILGAIHFA